MGTSLQRAMSLHDISQKACAYEMAAEFVDGMDVLAVREATARAVERARKDYLPTLIEVRTYRFMGHSMSDPEIISEKDYQAMEKRVQEEVAQALLFADESPLPEAGELYTDVYANPITPGKTVK